MAGHSKWANTKHRKARVDAKRGQMFSKLAKEIMVAARQGGGDPDGNMTLRAVIQKARGVNMPADNIDRAIRKGTGELAGEVLEEILYEGYAPGGIAILIETLTDNRNRCISEVRNVFTKNGGRLAETGTAARKFQRKGQIFVDAAAADEDRLFELVAEAGAEDIRRDGDQFEVLTEPGQFAAVVEALQAAGIEPASAELAFLADVEIPIDDRARAESLIRFVELLEDLDDVRNVYADFAIDDAILDAINAE